jgi:hypothetical protein
VEEGAGTTVVFGAAGSAVDCSSSFFAYVTNLL